jgi:aminoglycoside phosphotransferase family enzyme/predicted kinase/GNAT superfamily N-acetyltransferase
VLADGGRVQLRPIRIGDAPGLVALHGRLSEESVYLRYFSPHSHLSPQEIGHATAVDHLDREALVVLDHDQLIGVGSYERSAGSDAAEVAFEVEDAHQGRGIGTLLFESLAAVASERGIRRFFAHVLPQNRRMLDLFHDVGLEKRAHFEGGVVEVELALSPASGGPGNAAGPLVDALPGLSPEELTALAAPGAYPDDPSAALGVEQVQTHLSQVFLTGRRVYKFRKAVDLGFVCFTARAERNADCLREVALNRRLAPDVYLGVAPLLHAPVRIGPVAEALVHAPGAGPEAEHCVVMRRLPAGRDALTLLARGALSGAQIERAAAFIARFHEQHGLGTPAPFTPEQWRQRCVGPAQDNLRLLGAAPAGLFAGGAVAGLEAGMQAFAEQHGDRFERRRLAGRAVDGHGDLHLQHLWYERDDAEPIAIDCLEFSESLRCIDTAAEVAFLAMDLRYRGAAAQAERFLRVYARERDDFDLYAVVDYFASYRAAVRAKVASIAAMDAAIDPAQRARASESARRHLELAAQMLAARGRGALVLVGGIVGSGKSSAAAELADAAGAVVIASDRVRKRLAGVATAGRSGDRLDQGLYDPAHSERVYAGLLARAAPVLDSGRIALLDATWSRAANRERARRFARERGVRTFFIETRCTASVALERLARREAQGADPSDAGPAFHAHSAARFEPPTEWPAAALRVVQTDRDDWRIALRAIAADLPRPVD